MFETFDATPPETILQIAAAYNADPRGEKMDLGIGVYRDAEGRTTVMEAVKSAERLLLETQDSKVYLGLSGDADFTAEIARIAVGDMAKSDRAAALQTPGGSGALRLCYELLRTADRDVTVWLPDPSWANHAPSLALVGLKTRRYPYYDNRTGGVDFDRMRQALKGCGPADVVILHGCCHNPTGADLTPAQWDEIAALCTERGFLPLIDLAYQGFGQGLEADSYGARALAAAAPELLLAYSCSKNFAIYRERTGFALALSHNADATRKTLGKMKMLVRANHSMPPDHGAATVRTILKDAALRQSWQHELEQMRQRIIGTRTALASGFRDRLDTDRMDFIAAQSGMFSLLPLTAEHAQKLQADHAIYLVPDGRINIAGLKPGDVTPFVDAVAEVVFPAATVA